jgi:hypothetical protein
MRYVLFITYFFLFGTSTATPQKGPPSDSILGPHIQSICEALDIPHLENRFDIETGAKEFSINLYPAQRVLNDAILQTVKFLNWTRYAIIYEGNLKIKMPPRSITITYVIIKHFDFDLILSFLHHDIQCVM